MKGDQTDLGDFIRRVSTGSAGGYELVVDPKTGKIAKMPAGSNTGTDVVITPFIEEGFAAEANPIENLPTYKELFARGGNMIACNKGKRALILGEGSMGSKAAVMLASAGFDTFALWDNQTVECANIMRHVAGLSDIGRYKVDVVAEHILEKNPHARVDKIYADVLNDPRLLEMEIAKSDFVICCFDRNALRLMVSKEAARAGKICVFGRAFSRAVGGDVMIQRPGGPCYGCFLGIGNGIAEEITDEAKARSDGRIPDYTSAEDAAKLVYMGLANDIAPIIQKMVQVVMVEAARGTEAASPSLENSCSGSCYMWVNRAEGPFAAWADVGGDTKRPRVQAWYEVELEKNAGCTICSSTPSLIV